MDIVSAKGAILLKSKSLLDNVVMSNGDLIGIDGDLSVARGSYKHSLQSQIFAFLNQLTVDFEATDGIRQEIND